LLESEFADRFEPTSALAATPASDAHVIRVSDDAIVITESPDANFGNIGGPGIPGLPVGLYAADANSRVWLKFDLSDIPRNLCFTRATVNLFCGDGGAVDEPIGLYYSGNDTWDEDTITWNNAPSYDSGIVDMIDSPSNPNMFVTGNWYAWEITTEVQQALAGDGVLSFVLRLVDESSIIISVKQFNSKEASINLGENTIPNIALEYEAPITSGLEVDGFSSLPQIDYIKSLNPELSWTSSDADPNDFQMNYEVEVWNNSNYDETILFEENTSIIETIHNTEGAGGSLIGIFSNHYDSRYQYLWPESMISQSGIVDKLYFEVDQPSGQTTFTDLAIYMTSVESNLTDTFETNYDGTIPVQVLNQSSYTARIENGYLIFDIENTFVLRSDLKLLIELRHSGVSGTSIDGVVTDSGGWLCAAETDGFYSAPMGTVLDFITQGLKVELVGKEVLGGDSTTNNIPFGLPTLTSGRFQFKYNQSLIDKEGTIDRIFFPVSGYGEVLLENFSVYLAETPIQGELSHTEMDSNYGGQTPTLVLNQSSYTVRNLGHMLVIDVDDLFYYSNTADLLIELRYDSLVSGHESIYYNMAGAGAYRAYDTYITGNDTASYDLSLGFIHSTHSVTYTGTPLVNGTRYYWRVRICDSIGVWSDWENGDFKYEILTSLPTWSNLAESAQPLEFGQSITISIDVTHTSGILSVEIEYGGLNHSMSNLGDTYSYTWTPDSVAIIPYMIFMQSQSGSWNSLSDSIVVVDSTPPEWISAPTDKVLFYGDSLSIQFTATDLSGIASWTVSDTVHFEIENGLLTNKTTLEPGGYFLNVTVSDNEGNSLSSTFYIAVLQTSTTTETTSNTTGTNLPPLLDPVVLIIIIGLVIVIVVLLVIIIMQHKKQG